MAGLNDTPVKDPMTTVDPALTAKQEAMEVVEVEPVAVVAAEPTPPAVTEVDKDLESLSMKELQAVATKMGFVGAELFQTRTQMLTVIKNLKVRPTISATLTPEKVDNPTEAKNWEGKRERTKKFMLAQPTIRTMIPLDLGEKIGAFAELQINGYKIIVPKGKYVNLPEPFADLVAYSYNQTAEAGKDFLLDRPGADPESGKTVAEILA